MTAVVESSTWVAVCPVESIARESGVAALVHGEPVRFGVPGEDGLGRLGVFRSADGSVRVEEVTTANLADVVVHDAHAEDPTGAYALSRLTSGGVLDRAPIGIFRQVHRPTYDDQARQQVATDTEARGEGDLQALLDGADTWTVDA